MTHALFVCLPAHGHLNPMLGLADELLSQGEKVTFFCGEKFRRDIEAIGAEFHPYTHDLNIFGAEPDPEEGTSVEAGAGPGFLSAALRPQWFIQDVLDVVGPDDIDYLVASSAYPFASVIAEVLEVPTIYSYAVFAPLDELFAGGEMSQGMLRFIPASWLLWALGTFSMWSGFGKARRWLLQRYGVRVPRDASKQFMNRGALNIVYSSEEFTGPRPDHDATFLLIGAATYRRKYSVDFPLHELEHGDVIYISLGTVFSDQTTSLYDTFFAAFANTDAKVVMAAHGVDFTDREIPANFIVRDFVPQLEVLKHATVAITHAGANSLGDIIQAGIPFISIPLGADQFYLSKRAAQLGATIVLNSAELAPGSLRDAVALVKDDPSYASAVNTIRDSYLRAGGYAMAAERIRQLLTSANQSPSPSSKAERSSGGGACLRV